MPIFPAWSKAPGQIMNIVQTGDPVLRQVAQPIDPSQIGTRELNELIDRMIATMRDAPGVGLAAPQVGLSMQLVVLEDRAETLDALDDDYVDARERQVVPLHILINPTIELIGDKMVEFYEGCLSIAGYAAVTPRSHEVCVRALDQKGEEITLNWRGWPARILQHEIDHLAGNLYIDHMDTRTFADVDNL